MADTNDKNTLRRWRLLVATCLVVFTGHVLWAAGLLSGVGLHGFATQDELRADIGLLTTQIRDEQIQTKSIQVTLLEQSIMQARSQQCQATHKSYFAGVLSGLEDQYIGLQGHRFAVPDCEDLT